jgi:RNA polymerase sigma-70 factor (ECF subfamily)
MLQTSDLPVIELRNGVGTGCDFAELVREHQSMVFSVAWHFLRDRAVAEEVAQEVFLSLHRNLASIQSPAHAVSWLRKVAVQRSIDEGRRRNRRPQVALQDVAEPVAYGPGGGAMHDHPMRDPMLGETLRRLIATLPEAPRSVMILRYQEDLEPAEIAATLNMPVGTVKSHLQRSLAMLREKLERRGEGKRRMGEQ